MGIEPTSLAWKAKVIPIYDTRNPPIPISHVFLVEGGGFEPPKAEPTDLQSVPFGRSGTPPKKQWDIIP